MQPMRRRHFGALLLAVGLTTCSLDTTSHDSRLPPPPELPTHQIAWLNAAAIPLTTVDPSHDDADLEPLRAMIGNARVVALGEATHGTGEFFRMKDRILRFLVREMGFDAFAIEATWPEANRLDAYVRSGTGAADSLLSGLYFWTWNTQEVLDLIQWLRDYNVAAGAGGVGFYGFDMQYPGMAIHNIRRFVQAVDVAADSEFTARLACLAPFSNDSRGQFPGVRYNSAAPSYRDQCHGDLEQVHATLAERRQAYESASSPAEFARALHSARVAIQYEEMASGRRSRDAAMAENALWLLRHLGPDGKIVLWAHNFHVSTLAGAMGRVLRDSLGNDVVILGFSFANGRFNAVRRTGSTLSGLQPLTAAPPQPLSYEHYFSEGEHLRFLLDLRNRTSAGDSAAWLAGPRRFRSIGAIYDPNNDEPFGYNAALPNEFDLMIYLATSSPSILLPFRMPSAF
ncbi:MAG TPA: erythromycin esterase family protein [Gemmatimonadales bacterium]|nr:erythromycin esterase family protein [Gemmatimonadales bacterium]